MVRKWNSKTFCYEDDSDGLSLYSHKSIYNKPIEIKSEPMKFNMPKYDLPSYDIPTYKIPSLEIKLEPIKPTLLSYNPSVTWNLPHIANVSKIDREREMELERQRQKRLDDEVALMVYHRSMSNWI